MTDGYRVARPALITAGSGALSAMIAWAVLACVGRGVTAADYSDFAALWAVYFAFAGACAGLQQQVIRMSARPRRGRDLRGGSVRVAAAVTGLSVAVVFVAVAALAGAVDGRNDLTALAVGLVGIVGQFVVLGELAADGRWVSVGGLVVADSAVRLLLVAAVLLLVDDGRPDRLAWSTVVPSFVWLPWLVSRRARSPVSVVAFAGRAVPTMMSTGSVAVLVTGLPAVIAVTVGGKGGTLAAALAGLVLFRSPILAITNAVRPVLLVDLMTAVQNSRAGGYVWRAWGIMLVGATGVAIGAFALGPLVLRLAFGADFELGRLQAAFMSLSGCGLAMAALSGVVLVAAGEPAREAVGWVAGIVVTLVALELPIRPLSAVMAAVLLGPAACLVVHAALINRLIDRRTSVWPHDA